MRGKILGVCAIVCVAGCGGANAVKSPQAASAAAEPKSSASPTKETESGPAETAAAEEPAGLPTKCSKSGEVCTPGSKFVDRVCSDVYPGVALAMFQKSAPWTHMYLNRTTKAWNASGGASQAVEVVFDEEVLVLRKREAAAGGIQVSGAGAGFDVLRWDGSCVSLSAEELTPRPPPAPKAAHIDWRYLDDPIQEALRADDTVNKTYLARRNECKGATSGAVTKKCEILDKKLSDVIVGWVRGGAAVPTPTKLP